MAQNLGISYQAIKYKTENSISQQTHIYRPTKKYCLYKITAHINYNQSKILLHG